MAFARGHYRGYRRNRVYNRPHDTPKPIGYKPVKATMPGKSKRRAKHV